MLEGFDPGEMLESEFNQEAQKLYGSPVPFEEATCWDGLISHEEKFCIKSLEDDSWKGQCSS